MSISILSLVGKRVLLKMPGGRFTSSRDIDEYRILEVSPSGNFVRLQNTYGNKFWRPVTDLSFLEELKDLRAERRTLDPTPDAR